jgi:hypothetical protein
MTIGTYGIGNYVVGNANIGTSGLDYISNGSGYDISYIVTDDTPGSGGSFRPGFKTNYSTSFSDSYYYQYWSTYFSVGDTIKTNLLSNGSTATITWYHKPSGASTFDQLSQTTGLSITDWYVWVSGWCDSGDIKASYTAEYTGAPTDMTLISTATTAEATPTTGDIVMTYTNGAGTATVNTDLKAWISRDNGSTYTQATLSSEGTTGGHTILTAHNVDISSQPSGTSMRYKITTHNQSESKETRIQAVSLGWG